MAENRPLDASPAFFGLESGEAFSGEVATFTDPNLANALAVLLVLVLLLPILVDQLLLRRTRV